MVIGHRERAEPRRFHTRVLRPDLGCGARALCPGRVTIRRLQGVRTLGEVLASGKFHPALETNLRNSQAVESRDT
jgi:hypothetical protein